MVVALVVPQRRSLDRGGFDLFGRLEHEDVPEALPREAPQRPPQLGFLLADHVRTEVAVVARRFRSWQIRSGRLKTIATGRQWYCRASSTSGLRASGWTLVASTTVSRPSARRLAGDEVQDLEGLVGDGLVVLVVADHRAAGVGREDLGRQEVLAGEGALARAAGADQDDEGQLGMEMCMSMSYSPRLG